jgi:hypothetical protein
MFCGNFCLISFDRFNHHLQLKRHSHQKEKTPATATFLHNHHSQTIDQSIKRIDHNKTTQPWLLFVEALEELVLDKTARPPYATSSKKPLAFQPTADGYDLSQFIDHHDDSDDDDFNDFNKEDDNANDTQIGQRLANLRDNFNPENI